MTSFGAVVRADSVQHLTPAGQRALVDYGVRTIVDLRRHDERTRDVPLELPVELVHVPLDDWHHEEIRLVWRGGGDDEAGVRAAYGLMTEELAPNFVQAIEAVADAPPGGVVVHCYAGKDRTGLTCAMLLRLAGVGPEDIAADYGLSGENIRQLIEPWANAAPDDRERALQSALFPVTSLTSGRSSNDAPAINRLVAGEPKPDALTVGLTATQPHADGLFVPRSAPRSLPGSE